MFQLKGLTATSKKEVREVVQLLLFHHFLSRHSAEYKTILRGYEQQKIMEVAAQLTHIGSELLTSKILSIVLMVAIKYGESYRITDMGEKTITLRRQVELKYYGREGFNISQDYTRTTFFFAIKYLEAQLKDAKGIYEMPLKIQAESALAVKYRDEHLISDEYYEVIAS